MATVRGMKEKGWLEFKYRNTGEPIRFPVGTIYGAKDGPTLVVVGGMHGSEFCGIEAAIRLFREVDPERLCGTLKVGTIYNLPAFVNNLGFVVPHDGKNPMSTFPGSPIGTYGEAMAYYFDQEVLSKADSMVELHGGDIPEALTPFTIHVETGDPNQDAASKAMSEAYNLAHVVRYAIKKDEPKTAAFTNVAARGKPAILCESGQQGILDEHWVEVHLTGLRNILVHLGMLEGKIINSVKRIYLDNYTAIRSDQVGMWYPIVEMEQMVKKDQVVGYLRDYFGDQLAEIKAPFDGLVSVIRTSPAVRQGNVLMEVGEIVSREG